MPWITNIAPEIMEYIERTMRFPTLSRRIGWVPQSYVDQAIAELVPVATDDPHAAGNAEFAAEAERLRISRWKRKALRWQQRMEAAKNEYRRQRERDAAMGKPPVTKL